VVMVFRRNCPRWARVFDDEIKEPFYF